MSDKKYVGKGKIVGVYGNIKIGLKYESLKPNEKGYCNLIIGKMKEKDKYNNEYTVWIDEWEPSKTEQAGDIPF
jgi:hypothetical protein